MKLFGIIILAFLLSSCDNDIYEKYPKSGIFTINKLKEGGKRSTRGFYVNGSEDRIRYRNIRSGKYKIGDKIKLSYDSIANKTKGTYELDMQRRLED